METTLIGKMFHAFVEVLNSGGFAAIITAVGAMYIGKLQVDKNKSEKETKKLQREIKDLSSGVLIDLSTFNEITHKVNNIFNQTKIDRFLILSAMNGKEDLRICTANFEQINILGHVKSTLSLGSTGKYLKFAFDKAYRDMLKRIERTGAPEICKVSEMPDCDLRRIYMAEKVTEAHVYFLKRVKIDEDNDRVFYCSYATHQDGGISEQDGFSVKLYHQQVSDIFESIVKHNLK